MALESNTRTSAPPGPSVSTIARTFPFGLMARNWRVLFALARVDGHDFVGEAEFLQQERHLRGIGCRVETEADHGTLRAWEG
jgi:hypothetical protein